MPSVLFQGIAIEAVATNLSLEPSFAAHPFSDWWRSAGSTACLLGGILLIAALLRFYQIGKTSFWIDELISAEQTTGMGLAHERLPAERFLQTPHAATALHGAAPWWNIWTSLSGEDQPPLHYIVLRAWRDVFGEGDVPARALSAVLSVLAIGLLYLAAEPLHGRPAAMWACAIMALAGPQIEFGQEAGSYAMVMTLSLAMAVALVRIEKRGATPLRLTMLGLSALAALLTHYVAIGAALAAAIYALIRLGGRTRWRTAAVLLIATIAFLAAWGPFLLGQSPLMSEWSALRASNQNLSEACTRWIGLPVHLFVMGDIDPQAIALWSGILYFLPFVLLRRRPDLLLWALWLVGTTLPLALLDARYSTDWIGSMRYTLVAAPAAYVLAAAFLADQRGYRKHAIAIVLTLSCVLTLPDAYVRWKEDWRGFASYVATRCKPGDVMIFYRRDDADFTADAMYLALSHYLPQGDRNGSFEVPIVIVDGPVPYTLLRRITAARRVWVINANLQSVASELFPGGTLSEERHFPIMPYAATIARIQPSPLGIPFLR
jgi:hypothetical protein